MTQEIVRELVGGVWVTRAVNQGGGPGGGITEITSTDMSVTITDPTGPTADLSVSGGSQTVLVSTITATEVAARWDAGSGSAAVQLGPAAGAVVLTAFVEADGFDNALVPGEIWAYPAGATSAQVHASGDPLANLVLPLSSFGADAVDTTAQGPANLVRMNAGGALYLTFTGDDAPTTGECVVTLLVLNP